MRQAFDDLDALIERAGVPGASVAVVRSGRVDLRCAGVIHTVTRVAVNDETIFDAASLSKPVFAYAVLRLIDAGYLSLETKLSAWVPEYVDDDTRSAVVTVGQALCHSTGLPNWRSAEFPLRSHFAPGQRFSYSGEGYTWLQKVVERITGEPLEQLMCSLVFQPLAMTRSSYVWQPAFETNHVAPHDSAQQAGPKRKPQEAMAAFSLHTTAGDYARFLQAVLTGAHLRSETASLWLKPHVSVRRRGITAIRPGLDVDTDISWGLGWGLDPAQGAFFQWGDGDQGRHKTFAIGSVSEQAATVILTNGSQGMAIVPELVEGVLAGNQPCIEWLGYERLPKDSS
ncbi:serine hydrolase domain-containing protein [Ancylobacter defluvii]|uniref:serine hydrolase domain-containing protein n=1 Tax=Ancylobacter defluvii TaxID=1282440 RepID=UPI001BD08FD8|nr:serine hydrolase domain-containing protein [Ancylobacter defluvii]MBS7590108.1 beta-lactamase family protein [Ancylobacter defluvii]